METRGERAEEKLRSVLLNTVRVVEAGGVVLCGLLAGKLTKKNDTQ